MAPLGSLKSVFTSFRRKPSFGASDRSGIFMFHKKNSRDNSWKWQLINTIITGFEKKENFIYFGNILNSQTESCGEIFLRTEYAKC